MADRRTFLRGLVALPLIGGGVSLIGQPSAVAEPVTPDLLEGYKTWLEMERRFLVWEMAGDPVFADRYPAPDRLARFKGIDGCFWFTGDCGHSQSGGSATPYDRAALVLSAVGCDWRDR